MQSGAVGRFARAPAACALQEQLFKASGSADVLKGLLACTQGPLPLITATPLAVPQKPHRSRQYLQRSPRRNSYASEIQKQNR